MAAKLQIYLDPGKGFVVHEGYITVDIWHSSGENAQQEAHKSTGGNSFNGQARHRKCRKQWKFGERFREFPHSCEEGEEQGLSPGHEKHEWGLGHSKGRENWRLGVNKGRRGWGGVHMPARGLLESEEKNISTEV